MVKNPTLTSDVDFIKEFEELKLKQKLLIDSLNKKNISQQNQLFLEINSKLDFLVKIFKDANDTDTKAEEEKLETHFKEILDKITLVETGINEKFTNLETGMTSIKEEIVLLKEKKVSVPESIKSAIPNPNFEVKTPIVAEQAVSQTEKKGWFK